MPSNQNPRRQYARNPHNRKPDDRKPGTHQLDNASIGDRVFLDSNGNGIQDQGEIGIAGSTVKLLDALGNVIATAITDAYGNYQFSQLAAGDYRVMFVQPDGFTSSPVNQGSDDALDSDADPDNGLMTDIITLGFCEKNDTIDAGFVEVASGTLEIVSFEFVFQNPDAANIADKILTQRLFKPNEAAEFVETALLIPELGESFSQLLTLTAEGGDVEAGTFTLTISNPFVDVTSITLQGSSVNLIASQTDDGEQQVTTIELPSTLVSGDEIVLEVVSTVTNAITDTDENTPVEAITANPLKEFDFTFALVDNPDLSNDFGDATFEGKIYTSQRFFDTTQGSSEYDLLEINNYLIEASVSGGVSSSLKAEVFTVAGNLREGAGGANPASLHTLYFSEISGGVDPEKKRKNRNNPPPPLNYSDPTVLNDFFLEWEPRPGIDISDFVDASGTDGYLLWLDLVQQGIFIQEFATTVSKTGTPSQFATDTFSQTTIGGNIVDPDNLPPLPSFIVLTFGQNENQTLSTKATQDGEIIEISQGLPGQPAPNAGPFEIFAVDSPDANPQKSDFVDQTSFDRRKGIGIIDGDDGKTDLAKQIDGDEILGIAVTGFVGRDALISLNCPISKNAEIRVEAYRNGYLVDSELFSLGSRHQLTQQLDFTSNGLFDTLHLSAGNSNTRFTFQLVELTTLESVA